MKFKLAKQNQGAGVAIVKSSVGCPSQSTLSTTDKGLIAGLAVLGAIVLGFLAYKLYRYSLGAPETKGGVTTPAWTEPRLERPTTVKNPPVPPPEFVHK